MSSILISINPEYVDKIFDGCKKYEYRKVKCKKAVDKMVIYCTSPVMKVVGEAIIEEIIDETPEKVWDITKNASGVCKEFFDKYYMNKNTAIAYKLKNVVKYNIPKELSDYGIKIAPQSYVYLDD